MTKLLTNQKATAALGLKPATIRAWLLRCENLPFVHCGRSVRIPAEAIARFIAENTMPAPERQ